MRNSNDSNNALRRITKDKRQDIETRTLRRGHYARRKTREVT